MYIKVFMKLYNALLRIIRLLCLHRLHSAGCSTVINSNVEGLEKVSMGHGCPRLLFLFHLQLNIGYTISEQDTIYILQTEFIATLFL